MERSLVDLLAGGVIPEAYVRGDAATTVNAIVHDSRRVAPGALFCCVRGGTVDGHEFAEAAVATGATARLVDHTLDV